VHSNTVAQASSSATQRQGKSYLESPLGRITEAKQSFPDTGDQDNAEFLLGDYRPEGDLPGRNMNGENAAL